MCVLVELRVLTQMNLFEAHVKTFLLSLWTYDLLRMQWMQYYGGLEGIMSDFGWVLIWVGRCGNRDASLGLRKGCHDKN